MARFRLVFLMTVVGLWGVCASCALVQPGANLLQHPSPWIPDLGNGQYKNPVLFADYSDPDVIRVGGDFYLTASSFNHVPGLPILHSKDLVNWTLLGHVFQQQTPAKDFATPQHGMGVWAPSIRYHNGRFYVYYVDPDRGVMVATARNPAGPWDGPRLIRPAKGWIDCCPLWDDDGQAYLVHAWANSRSGVKSVLTINRLSADGMKVLDEGKTVFDGQKTQPTIEGPKLYKRHGYYYIFAPAGGVKVGWQTVLRSRNIYGPYEEKIVLHQGSTPVNGPHQGGWVELKSGENWFMHFQDRVAYGRVVHLQPMKWVDDWPVMGVNQDAAGIGEPALTCRKPDVGKAWPIQTPPASDEFDARRLGPQWQWQANAQSDWYSMGSTGWLSRPRRGWLSLNAMPVPQEAKNLWMMGNLLLQKFPAPNFTVTTKMTFEPGNPTERAGLTVFGMSYAYLAVGAKDDGLAVIQAMCAGAERGWPVKVLALDKIPRGPVWLRVAVKEMPEDRDSKDRPECVFSYSLDGQTFKPLGQPFRARESKWVGAKVGLFCIAGPNEKVRGHADFDWFRVE